MTVGLHYHTVREGIAIAMFSGNNFSRRKRHTRNYLRRPGGEELDSDVLRRLLSVMG
jgi:hypothetical protein